MASRPTYSSSDAGITRPSFKLFVGCISYDAAESDLMPIFESFGEIVEFVIQRDREGRSRGCAWLKYSNQDACDNCIAALSNKYYVNGMRSAIVVKYANPQEQKVREIVETPDVSKLFVGGYPIYATDDEILRSLSMFGDVSDFTRLTRSGLPTGPVFVTFFDPLNANTLLNANGATIFMNSENVTESVPVTLRVSAAFSPVSQANSSPSLPSESPRNATTLYTPSPTHQSTLQSTPFANPHLPAAGKLFVGCLPYSRNSEDLSSVFSQYGPLVEVALLMNPEGKSKGAAFVTFVNREDAERAMNELQGYTFPNSSRGINISFATKQARPTVRPPLFVPSPSSSATTYSNGAPANVSDEPLTPPGFTAAPRIVEKTESYSILHPGEDLMINTELLRSLFGDDLQY